MLVVVPKVRQASNDKKAKAKKPSKTKSDTVVKPISLFCTLVV